MTLQLAFDLDGTDSGGQFCGCMSECLFDADLPCTLFEKMAKDDDVDDLPPVRPPSISTVFLNLLCLRLTLLTGLGTMADEVG